MAGKESTKCYYNRLYTQFVRLAEPNPLNLRAIRIFITHSDATANEIFDNNSVGGFLNRLGECRHVRFCKSNRVDRTRTEKKSEVIICSADHCGTFLSILWI